MRRVIHRPGHSHRHGQRRQNGERYHRFASVTINQLHDQKPDEWQCNQGGPEVEALEGNDLVEASHKQLGQRSSSAQAKDHGEPEAQE